MNTEHPLKRFWSASVVLAVWLAFFVQPVLIFADFDKLLGSAMTLGAGVFGVWVNSTKRDLLTILILMGGTMATIVGGIGLVTAMLNVSPTLRANNRRCLAIQQDMLSAHRRMSDGPNVFQALGCRAQGQGVIRVPPTDRELRAKHALKDGGYPNR